MKSPSKDGRVAAEVSMDALGPFSHAQCAAVVENVSELAPKDLADELVMDVRVGGRGITAVAYNGSGPSPLALCPRM